MTGLAEKTISVTAPRMGRPRLDKEQAAVMVPVRFTADMLAQIEAVAGKHQRAAFIREAVERELERRKG